MTREQLTWPLQFLLVTTALCSFGNPVLCQKNLLDQRSKSTYTSTYTTSKVSKSIRGTATIIYANEPVTSCATMVGGRIISLKPSGLTFLNLELRDEILSELRLQMEGVYVSSDGGDRSFPLLCDYFFYIRANDTTDDKTLVVQLVDAQTGEIIWSFSKSASECDDILTAISSQL